MSDIQRIIELIDKGYRNGDYSQGQRQVNDAMVILRKMQEDSHLHSGQRWELSQILECGPLYGDIKKAVRELKEAMYGLCVTGGQTETFLSSSLPAGCTRLPSLPASNDHLAETE